jgi:hypothetical protein
LRDLTKVEEIPHVREYLRLLSRPFSKLKSSLHRVRTSFEALPGFPLAIAGDIPGSWPKNPAKATQSFYLAYTHVDMFIETFITNFMDHDLAITILRNLFYIINVYYLNKNIMHLKHIWIRHK